LYLTFEHIDTFVNSRWLVANFVISQIVS